MGNEQFGASAAERFPHGLPSASLDAAALAAVGRDAADQLAELIRAESVNPPGNETRPARVLIELLKREGLQPEFYEPIPGRGNVSVRLRGEYGAADANLDPRDAARGALLLFAHLDVVPANQDGWTVDPFAGEIKEGYVWGRGAVDMKGALAVQVGVIRLLCARARAAGRNPAVDPIPGLGRDIILTATADEEAGGLDGIALVLRDHPSWLDAAVALTEAGGMTITAAGRRIYPLQVAEKGFARFALSISGRWGHASMPDSDNALLRAAAVVERVSVPGPVQFVPENRALVDALKAALPTAALARLDGLLGEITFDDAKELNAAAPAAGATPDAATAAAPVPPPAPSLPTAPLADQTVVPVVAGSAAAKPAAKAEKPHANKREAKKAPAPAPEPVAPPANGSLAIAVSPWGEVLVDGSSRGISPPLSTLTLPAGRHTIEIRNGDFEPMRMTVEVKPNETTRIRHKF